MGVSEHVRASRDGDRFHYYWAAQRALRLLDPNEALTAVSIEGLPPDDEVEGEEVIDVAEFYGGEDLLNCDRARFVQVKHSTLRTGVPITASELRTTLTKFAGIYRGQPAEMRCRLTFSFVANRTLNAKVHASLTELADGNLTPTHPEEAALLRRYLGFANPEQESDFCQHFAVEDGTANMAEMEERLQASLRQHLPGAGTGSELSQLMEAVSRRATSLASRPTLTKADVLLALRTTEFELFPAPSAIDEVPDAIVTDDVANVLDLLRSDPNNKILLTAIGGVGKSVLTTLLEQELREQGSVVVTYDCFAHGAYRQITSRRHEHRIGLTQLSNELARQNACSLLVPTDAQAAAYARAFMQRIGSAAENLRRTAPEALLVVVIDAADNAAMAAKATQSPTFVTDLLREEWPANARLIELCRPERVAELDLPFTGVTIVPLVGFGPDESLKHLRGRFPDASSADGNEFHTLSGGNPRVQARALEQAADVPAALHALAIANRRPGVPLDSMLADQVAVIADEGHLTVDELGRLCTALGALPPPIPVEDLAAVARLDADTVRSFATALGRALFVAGDTFQFRDEPTETWFRNTYRLSQSQQRSLVQALQLAAPASAYIANVLPQLLFESDMFDELAALAISDSALPREAEPAQAQEIARSRTCFALAAMLRISRFGEAARLAVRAGAMSAGHARTLAIYRSHPDLAAQFLSGAQIDALCSGRDLVGEWPGSNLIPEAAILSAREPSRDLGRSRLRSAFDNLVAISQLPQEERNDLGVRFKAAEMAALMLAALNVGGPSAAITQVQRWRDAAFRHDITRECAARLADAGRNEELDSLIQPGKRQTRIHLGVLSAMFTYNIAPSQRAIAAAVTMLARRTKAFKNSERALDHDLNGIVWTVVHGLRHGVLEQAEALRILEIHLPHHLRDWAGSYWPSHDVIALLLGLTIREHLEHRAVTLEAIVSQEMREHLARTHVSDHQAQELQNNIGPLLPWVQCWMESLLEGTEPATSIDQLLGDLPAEPRGYSGESAPRLNVTLEVVTRLLAAHPTRERIQVFDEWLRASDETVWAVRPARIALRTPPLQEVGLALVTRAVQRAQRDRSDAETRADTLIQLARVVLATSAAESQAIFGLAVTESEQVGDDLHERWSSLLGTASNCGRGTNPRRAYRLFQIGEELHRAADVVSAGELGARLHDLHFPTHLACASKARDRRTLDFRRTVGPAIEGTTPALPSRLALLAFNPESDWRSAIEHLPADQQTVVIEAATAFRRSDASPLVGRDSASRWSLGGTAKESLQVREVFVDADFTSTTAWTDALRQIRWDRQALSDLTTWALEPAAQRPDVIHAFRQSPDGDQRTFLTVAEIASTLPKTVGLTNALTALAETYATRFASQIATRYRDYDSVPNFVTATGSDQAELERAAFRELGRSAYELRYGDYFRLAANISASLPTSEAELVFDDLADLFEDLAPAQTTSDGAYDTLTKPTTDPESSIAALIWTALGDIEIKVRWQAAHAVHLLVQLGCKNELEALAQLAHDPSPAAAFLDSRFPFYQLHARWWLLLGLQRGANGPNALLLKVFGPPLAATVLGRPHAILQRLAHQTLQTLVDCDVLANEGAVETALRTVLDPTRVTMGYNESRERANPIQPAEDDRGRYHFFYDFERYWCDDVADMFGSTPSDVARRAGEVLRDLDTPQVTEAESDPRRSAGVFVQSGTWSDHGNWPSQEDYDFYRAIHAVATVGAELAATTPVAVGSEIGEDPYGDWLRQYVPKRGDGRWLADRRDPPPTPRPEAHLVTSTGDRDTEELWPWTITRSDFSAQVGMNQDWVTVWATGDTAVGRLDEDVHIRSALVTPDTAPALLIAMQTSPAGWNAMRLPTLGDWDRPPPKPPYELAPWLDDRRWHYGIDEHDEQTAGISYPPIQPGQEIITAFGLVADEDSRVWKQVETAVIRSRVWSNLQQVDRDRQSGTQGEKLSVRREFLLEMLTALDKSLVITSAIRRNIHRSSYERDRNDGNEFEWLEFSARVFNLDQSGTWHEF